MSKLKKIKVKKVLSGAFLATSFYFSHLFALGVVLGYLGTRFVYNRYLKDTKVSSIFLIFKKWKFHLHHWIVGAVILFIIWVVDSLYLPKFFTGVLCGLIIHDIYDFDDWYKVVVKNKTRIN